MDHPVRPGLRQRSVSFDLPEGLSPQWHTRLPEFAAAANSVSFMMPYVEPYVIRAVRQVLPRLDATLALEARAYISQEAQHHTQHRRFNEVIGTDLPGRRLVERWLESTFDWLWRSRSERFHLAYAAASEAVAYGAARWVERHHGELFRGADPEVTRLYLWHLAEEVEHKNVAYDIYDSQYRSRWPLAGAMAVSMLVLAWFAFVGTIVGLVQQRRLLSPVAIARLSRWSLSFVFAELPNMVASVLPGHHPSEFSDPTWFSLYLLEVELSERPGGPVVPSTSSTAETASADQRESACAAPICGD